jgi:FAD synthase
MTLRESWHKGRFVLKEYDSDKLVDALGKPLSIGDKVVRGASFGRSAGLEFTTIANIKNGRVYLASSKVPLNYPSRVLIVNDIFPDGFDK